ncbi:MAG: M1 family metallopeptidase, partial [Acidobacteriota bacterium]
RRFQEQLAEVFKEDKKSDFVFTPTYVTLFCDPHSCQDILKTRFTGLAPSSREDAGEFLRKAYDEYIHDQRESRHDDGFSGFHRPFDDDRRVVSAAVKKQSADHRIYLRSDNAAPRELTFSVSGYGPLYSYYSPATLHGALSPYELEKRPDLGSRYFDLQKLKGTVELGLDKSERLRADMTYSMVTRMPLRELPFSIARLSRGRTSSKEAKNPRMTIDSLQDADGNELTWVKTGPVSGIVILPETIPAGTALTVVMRFTNDDSLYRFTPSYAYVSRGGWLPFVHFEDRIDSFDLTVKAPAKYKVLSVGTMVDESTDKGVSTTRWVAKSPVTFPTVIYGDYVEGKPGFDAKTISGDKIPITIHVDRDGMRAWSIRPKQLKPLADDAANALNLYREIYGEDYPYGRLDLVNDPIGGLYGQSPASMIYLGSASFRGEGALGEAGGSGTTLFVKSLVAHEAAHQWWGGLINNRNQRNYWFVESLAEYSAALFVEARYGRDAYRKHVEAWRKEILDADLRVSVQDAPVLWSGGFAGYRAAVYAQGPYMFHIMRNTFGDEKFFAFLKALAHDLKGKEIVTRDIQKVSEKVFKVDMEPFFDQWIRGVGLPEYTVNYTTHRAEDGGYLVEGRIAQRVVLGKEKRVIPGRYFMAAVRLTVAGKKGKSYAKTLLVQGPETEFRV